MSEMTSERLDALLHGDGGANTAAEQAELQRWRGLLAGVPTSAEIHAAAQMRLAQPRTIQVRRGAWAIAASCTAAAVIAGVLLSGAPWKDQTGAVPEAHSTSAGLTDDALLQSVRDDVSATLPAAMQPLAISPNPRTTLQEGKD